MARTVWVHTAPDGKTKTYSSQSAANLAATRFGGTVHQSK